MLQHRAALSALLRPRLKLPGFNDDAFLAEYDRILDAGGMARDDEAATTPPAPVLAPTAAPTASAAPSGLAGLSAPLTSRIALEIIGHEAIVRELYLDSENVPTWGIGVTSRSGHDVERYRDNPQTIRRCIEVYIWLLRTRYLPDVLSGFVGRKLTEAQLAAALSFHYNTGAIRKTSWVDLWLEGKTAEARRFLETHYLNDGDLTERRKSEAALFFDGHWSSDGTTTVWPVKKPSYRPNWGKGERVDIRADVEAALAMAP